MPAPKIIEDLVRDQIRGLCENCVNFDECAYRRSTIKIIIQCEWYSAHVGQIKGDRFTSNRGLCMTCKHFETCKLPDKRFGVWHCEEYG